MTDIIANINQIAATTDNDADRNNDNATEIQASKDPPEEDDDVLWFTIRDIKLTQADKRMISM